VPTSINPYATSAHHQSLADSGQRHTATPAGLLAGQIIAQRSCQARNTVHKILQDDIEFSTAGTPSFVLEDALNNPFARMDGRDDLIFYGPGDSTAISLRFEPNVHMGPNSSSTNYRSPLNPIQKFKLAREVAKATRQLFKVRLIFCACPTVFIPATGPRPHTRCPGPPPGYEAEESKIKCRQFLFLFAFSYGNDKNLLLCPH
jgi:hypothetical protein